MSQEIVSDCWCIAATREHGEEIPVQSVRTVKRADGAMVVAVDSEGRRLAGIMPSGVWLVDREVTFIDHNHGVSLRIPYVHERFLTRIDGYDEENETEREREKELA